jgi:hypothetical protein
VPFFCGVIDHHPDSPLAKAGWAWPMSRVDVRESGVRAYTPVLFGRWTLDVPYAEIDEAVLRRHRWGGRIRLRRTDGDVTLTTMGGNYARIGNLLRDKGVRVTSDRSTSVTSP